MNKNEYKELINDEDRSDYILKSARYSFFLASLILTFILFIKAIKDGESIIGSFGNAISVLVLLVMLSFLVGSVVGWIIKYIPFRKYWLAWFLSPLCFILLVLVYGFTPSAIDYIKNPVYIVDHTKYYHKNKDCIYLLDEDNIHRRGINHTSGRIPCRYCYSKQEVNDFYFEQKKKEEYQDLDDRQDYIDYIDSRIP